MMPFSGGFFPGGIESTQNGIVLFSFAAAVHYLAMIKRPISAKRTLAKVAGILLLLGLAVMSDAPDLLVAALAFSAVGDAALAQDGDRAFMLGLGAFLLAHVAYAALFVTGGFENANFLIITAILVFAAIFGFVLVRKAGSLAIPVAAYVLAIASMGVSASLIGGGVLVGAVLFIASDAVLGSEKFLISTENKVRQLTGALVWILYFAGQATLTISIIRLSQLA